MIVLASFILPVSLGSIVFWFVFTVPFMPLIIVVTWLIASVAYIALRIYSR